MKKLTALERKLLNALQLYTRENEQDVVITRLLNEAKKRKAKEKTA